MELIIHTKCPEKWKIIDMETGQEYVGDKNEHPSFGRILKNKVSVGNIGQWRKIKWKQTTK